MFPYKTQYLNIHDRAYQKLKEEGAGSWSSAEDVAARNAFYLQALQPLPANALVLILGCGDGENALALAAKGYHITGLDVAPGAIEWAREKAAARGLSAVFQLADLTKVDLAVGQFQAVIDDHCLHCIVGPDRAKVLHQVHQALCQDGLFLLHTHCEDPPADAKEFLAMWDPKTRCQVHNGVAGRYFGKREALLREVQNAGFQTLSETLLEANGWKLLEAAFKRS